jgi:hypothetical protein
MVSCRYCDSWKRWCDFHIIVCSIAALCVNSYHASSHELNHSELVSFSATVKNIVPLGVTLLGPPARTTP